MAQEDRRGSRRWVKGAVALGAAGGAVAAWALQHRVVRRAAEAARAGEPDEGLVLPGDMVHHDIATDDGGTVHVVERGSGPVLLLVHGVMLSSELWVHQFTDLAAHHRVIAVDLRGHGRSEPGSARFRAPAGDPRPVTGTVSTALAGEGAPGVQRLAADLRTVIETLDLRHVLLVGHSMGGMVALQLLHDLPEDERHRRIGALALVSTTAGPFVSVPGWSSFTKLTAPVSARALLLAERVGGSALPSADVRWWVTRLGFGPEPVPAQVAFVSAMHHATPPGTLAELLPSLAVFDLSAGLEDVDVPTLVVVGSRDRLTPPRLAERMAAVLPQAQLVELPRCGHMPMLERRNEFSHLLEEFSAKTT
ncbi:MAG: alpha/beta fold hydrolase [Acidimicrobiales bacterium]